MADEKRIVEFEPATQLEIDDWIAVDSPNAGTRKMQKSMFMADEIASLQTLSTAMGIAQTDISNLQTRAGMSQNLNFGDNLTDGVNILSVLLGAEPYVNTRTYAVGEYCIYEKQLYKCTTAVTSAEDFDSNKWTLTNVKTELTELNSSLNDVITSAERNSIASPVSLDTYTSTNYICPSDGYVRCDCSAGTTAKAIADISGDTTGSFRMGGWANGTYGMYVCYVKKGMKVRVVTLENSGHIWFYSLV